MNSICVKDSLWQSKTINTDSWQPLLTAYDLSKGIFTIANRIEHFFSRKSKSNELDDFIAIDHL